MKNSEEVVSDIKNKLSERYIKRYKKYKRIAYVSTGSMIIFACLTLLQINQPDEFQKKAALIENNNEQITTTSVSCSDTTVFNKTVQTQINTNSKNNYIDDVNNCLKTESVITDVAEKEISSNSVISIMESPEPVYNEPITSEILCHKKESISEKNVNECSEDVESLITDKLENAIEIVSETGSNHITMYIWANLEDSLIYCNQLSQEADPELIDEYISEVSVKVVDDSNPFKAGYCICKAYKLKGCDDESNIAIKSPENDKYYLFTFVDYVNNLS